MSFAGLRVLSLESRRAQEIEAFIRRLEGDPFLAPSVQERAIEQHGEVVRFVERLESGQFDLVIVYDWRRVGVPARCGGRAHAARTFRRRLEGRDYHVARSEAATRIARDVRAGRSSHSRAEYLETDCRGRSVANRAQDCRTKSMAVRTWK